MNDVELGPETMKRIAANVALFATSLVLAIIACEGALRLVYPNAALGAGIELSWFRDPGSNMSNYMTTDDQIGFRPRLDTNVFDKNGLLLKPKDSSPSADVTRTVLFVGDSVTARARIVDAVRRELADPKSFFLNGGVESFNLAQVVNFFLRFQSKTPFDRIVHQVHGNDLQATPIVFRDTDGKLNVYALSAPRRSVNEWLFRHSYIYRLALTAFISRQTEQATCEEAKANFEAMVRFAKERGVPYDVFLFPVLRPTDQLTAAEARDWAILNDACRAARVNCISLRPVLDQMISENLAYQETPGDPWHPNDLLANRAGNYILDQIDFRKSAPGNSNVKN